MEMTGMTGKSYVSIQDWMYATLRINGKPLSLVELAIYALIHGFCFDFDGGKRSCTGAKQPPNPSLDTVYYGRADYVENLLGIPRTTYYRTLNRLCDSGLIVKQKISYDTIPRTVFYTAASRPSPAPTNKNATPAPSMPPVPVPASQGTQVAVPSMPVYEKAVAPAEVTPVDQSHSGTPTPTVGLLDSHSGTADSHSGTDTVYNIETAKGDNNTYIQAETNKTDSCMCDTEARVTSDETETKSKSVNEKTQGLSLANSVSKIWSNSPPSHSPINRVWFVNTDFPLGMSAVNQLRRQGEAITDEDVIAAVKNFISVCANPASLWETRYMKFSTYIVATATDLLQSI